MLKKALRLALHCALLLPLGILTAAPPDEFYVVRLRTGVEAYRRGNSVAAADEFRIACFGFLEHPVLLVEGLARLALAQAKTGRNAEADEALSRFAAVEQRFGKFQTAALEPALRIEFIELARKRMPPETFQAIPSLSGLPTSSGPAAEKVRTPPVPVEGKKPVPAEGKKPVLAEVQKPVPADAKKPVPAEGKSPASGGEAVAAAGNSQEVEAIRKLIDEGKTAEAWTQARRVLGKGVPSRALQKTALAAAVLSKDFAGGVPLAVSLDPFKAGEETDAFYAGVAFWETGKREKATPLFQIAAPRVAESPWVRYYLSRALGK